jgi:hypothetical protein
MSGKSLFIATLVAALAVGAAWLISKERAPTIDIDKPRLYPDLEARLNDVARLEVTSTTDSTVIVRRDGDWLLENRDGYRAAFEKVKRAAVLLAGLRVIEGKTSRPELYPKLEVEDVTVEDAKSTLFTLKDANDAVIASLILGKRRFAAAPGGAAMRYVRRAGEAQAWLVEGELDVSARTPDWMERSLLDIDSDRVREVRIEHPDSPPVVVSRADAEAEDFELADIPKGRKVRSPTTLTSLASALAGLQLDDVAAAGSLARPPASGTIVTYRTFDGLEVRVTLHEADDKTHAAFAFAVLPQAQEPAAPTPERAEPAPTDEAPAPDRGSGETTDAAAEDKSAAGKPEDGVQEHKGAVAEAEEKKESVAEEAERLNAALSGWLYALPQYNVTQMNKTLEDLTEPEAKDAVAPADDAAGAATD